MGTCKIALMAMKKSDFEMLLEKIKKEIVKEKKCWTDGPYQSKQGWKCYMTFEAGENDK